MKRLPQFDVFRAGMIGGAPLGAYLETIGASDHRAAKTAAEQLYAGIAEVVVLPAGTRDPDTAPSCPPVTIRDASARRGQHAHHHRTRR